VPFWATLYMYVDWHLREKTLESAVDSVGYPEEGMRVAFSETAEQQSFECI